MAEPVEKLVDTIIVGAGLSGLQAALDLHAAGKTIIILEAQDRVGGKTHSVKRPDGHGIQELGAAWMNDTNQSHVWEYCRRFNLTPVVQNIIGSVACENTDGGCHMFPFGELPRFVSWDVEDITLLRSRTESASLDPDNFIQPKRAEIDNLTFEKWCRNVVDSNQALRTATLWCRGTTGQDPSDVSALAFLEVARGGLGITNLRYDGKNGAQYLRLQEGTQTIAQKMANILPEGSLQMSCPAVAVTNTESSHYTVRTQQGSTIQAKSVIVSIPSPAYKHISFEPVLSPRLQSYIDSTSYGVFIKYICFFKTPFWKREGCCGLSQSFKGPINHCRDTSVEEQQNYALTCFITSTPGRMWSALSEDDKEEAVLRQLANLFDMVYQAILDEYLGHFESDWGSDPRAGFGCPFAVTPPGVLGNRDDDWFTESSDGMFIIGTEFTNEWRGYMEGALRSGKRGAAQALTYLHS